MTSNMVLNIEFTWLHKYINSNLTFNTIYSIFLKVKKKYPFSHNLIFYLFIILLTFMRLGGILELYKIGPYFLARYVLHMDQYFFMP